MAKNTVSGSKESFGKGTRVSFQFSGKPFHGTVASNEQTGAAMVNFDNGKKLSIPTHALRLSNVPPPRTFKKGERVTGTYQDKEFHATVVRASATKLTAILDGGKEELSGPHRLFKPSDRPLPASRPSEMDRWGVKAYKEVKALSQETPCFTAKITLDGKTVLEAENRGNGGADGFYRASGAPAGMQKAFSEACANWTKEFGAKEDMVEPESIWLQWYVNSRPYGVTAEQEIGSLNESIDALHGNRPSEQPGPQR